MADRATGNGSWGVSGVVDDVRGGDRWAVPKAFIDPSNKNFGPKKVLSELGLIPAEDVEGKARAAEAWEISRGLRDQSGAYNDQYNQAQQGLGQLGASLQNTISNPNASSVAQQQLGQSLQLNQAQQNSAASGVGGANAYAARRNAAGNIAGLNAKAGQDAALLRAQEVNNAQNSLGNVLGTQSQGAQNMFNSNNTTALGYANNAAGIGAESNKQNNASANGFAGLAGGLIGAISDPRAKQDIHDEDPSEIHRFLSALQPSEFSYKTDDEEDPERHGIMTTDLHRSKIGNSLVRQMPGGYEGFDVGQGLGAALSALGDMHRRVSALEGNRGR